MEKNYIKPTSRFGVFFLDFLFISLISMVISPLAYLIVGFDSEAYNLASEAFNNNFELFISGDISADVFYASAGEYLKYESTYNLISIGVTFVIMIPYFVIIPLKWEHQTLGRKIIGCKVYDMDNKSPDLKTLIIRELVGTFIFYVVLTTYIPLIVILYVVLACKRRISIVDSISKTRMIPNMLYHVEVDESKYSNYDKFDDNAINVKRNDINDDRIYADDINEVEDDDYKIV